MDFADIMLSKEPILLDQTYDLGCLLTFIFVLVICVAWYWYAMYMKKKSPPYELIDTDESAGASMGFDHLDLFSGYHGSFFSGLLHREDLDPAVDDAQFLARIDQVGIVDVRVVRPEVRPVKGILDEPLGDVP